MRRMPLKDKDAAEIIRCNEKSYFSTGCEQGK